MIERAKIIDHLDQILPNGLDALSPEERENAIAAVERFAKGAAAEARAYLDANRQEK